MPINMGLGKLGFNNLVFNMRYSQVSYRHVPVTCCIPCSESGTLWRERSLILKVIQLKAVKTKPVLCGLCFNHIPFKG